MWSPAFVIENEEEARHTEAREVIIHSDGRVTYEERFNARVHVEMDLRKFPFDSQVFKLVLSSFVWNEKSVLFKPLVARTGFDEKNHTLEWDIIKVQSEAKLKKEVRSKYAFSDIVLSIDVTRKPGYYVWKLIG